MPAHAGVRVVAQMRRQPVGQEAPARFGIILVRLRWPWGRAVLIVRGTGLQGDGGAQMGIGMGHNAREEGATQTPRLGLCARQPALTDGNQRQRIAPGPMAPTCENEPM